MRKIVLFTALLASFTINAIAQTYFPVTHTTGLSVVGGVSVTVSNTPGRTNPAPQTYCNASPYFIGATQAGGYVHSFSPGVTHIRLSVTDFQFEDTIYVKVNGVNYPITQAMLSDFGGCSDPGGIANNMDVFNGMVVNTLGGGARRDVQVTFVNAPSFINSVEVLHDRNNTGANGVVYGLEFALDSCLQPFDIVIDSPRCKDRPLKMTATNFPNTTFAWSTTAGTGSWSPSNTVYNPTYLNTPFSATGISFTCTATRGACVYTSTKTILVGNTPPAGPMKFYGPKCVGDVDTVQFPSGVGIVGGTTYIRKPNGTVVTCILPPTSDYIELPNIQLSDAGTYRGWAVTTEGCSTDTLDVLLTLNPVVKADFSFATALGCDADTVKFTDASLGNNSWNWTFGDGNSSTDQDPIHIYPATPATYTVKLVAKNSGCADSIEQLVVLNHPLVADFTVSDDSICQGQTVTFDNLSTAAPSTVPTYRWDFKDGDTSDQFEPTHLYSRYGVYDITMTITDFLGCQKTATKRLVVDSLGSASFFSDTVICAGESIQFLGDYSLIGGTYAEWDFADGHFIRDKFTIEHAYTQPGTYLVKLIANYRICPDTTYEQNIYVRESPFIDLGKDTSICFDGQPILLKDLVNAAGAPGIKWRWNTDTKDSTNSVLVHHPGKYAVTIDQDGCQVSDTIEVKKNCYIDIPNVFTPNGDGYNDYFLPRQLLGKGITKFSMVVYNRWGDVVFETNSLNGRGWDGKLNDKEQPGGVYIYVIKAGFSNGYSENYQGNVTLLR